MTKTSVQSERLFKKITGIWYAKVIAGPFCHVIILINQKLDVLIPIKCSQPKYSKMNYFGLGLCSLKEGTFQYRGKICA